MRKLIILILFMSGAANVSADCTQADLAGWWELSAATLSCSILLDEDGAITKANCQEYFWGDGGYYLGPRIPESRGRKIVGGPFDGFYNEIYGLETGIQVKDHCKVEGYFYLGGENIFPDSIYVFIPSGRINLDKSIVSGLAFVWFFSSQTIEASYTMVKF